MIADNPVRSHPLVSIKHIISRNTTILQTVPSSRFPDKPHRPPYSTSAEKNSPFLISRPSTHSAFSEQAYLAEVLNGFGKRKPPLASPCDGLLTVLSPPLSSPDCYINGTIYAEGSAIIASSFCEYCYCIRYGGD